MADDKLIEDFNDDMDGLSVLLTSEGQNKGPIWTAWHYLQVYSTWGLRLPFSEDSLKLKLSVNNPGEFQFFGSMMEAYKAVHDASKDFIVDIFPKVVGLGNDLKSFAADASDDDGEIFLIINELVDEGDEDSNMAAIELITDLQETATINAAAAAEVGTLLAGYKSELVEASGLLAAVKESIDADERINDAALAKLGGNADLPGSLANLQRELDKDRATYKKAVTVASTSVTYAWIVPIGLMTAATVAGVYGDIAVRALKDIKAAEDELKKASSELQTAARFNTVYHMAEQGVQEAHVNTGIAVQKATQVQNAWNGISNSLDGVKAMLLKMTKGGEDEDIVLKRKKVVEIYAERAGEKWQKLLPALEELTADPYIVVESDETDIDAVISEAETGLAAAA